MCKPRYGSQGMILDVFKQKKLKNLNGTQDPLHPPSWKIPLEISILFFGIPPQGQVPPTLHFQAIYISSWTLKLT